MPQVIPIVLGNIALGLTAGAGLATSAAAFSFATALGAAIASPLGLTLLLTGANLLLRGGSSSSAAAVAQATASIRQSAPAQRVIYGTQRIGGAVFFLDDSKPPYLYLGLLLSARKISALKAIYIGNVEVRFDSSGNASTTPFTDGTTTYVKFSFRNGDPAQAIDPLLAADFPNLDSSFRQRGIATAVFRFNFGADYTTHQKLWGNVQVPTVEIEVDGAPVYDPRDPTQDPDDDTTWKFSANAALIIADVLRQPYGGRFSSDQIDWDKVAAAAAYDDGLVGLKAGGYQHRYEIAGMVSLDQSPLDIVTAMLASNRGAIIQDQGKVWVQSAAPQTATFTIHDRLIAGAFSFQAAQQIKSLVNRVRSRFIAPDRAYEVADGPVLDRPDLRDDDGQLLEATLELPYVQTYQRAERLMQATLEASRIGRTLTVPVRLTERTLAIKAGDVGNVWSDLYPLMNGLYQVHETAIADDFSTISLTLVEYDGGIDGDWDPAMDEQDFVLADLDVS